jgi:aminoglycoside phosphotransferase (APT) family kinase protein
MIVRLPSAAAYAAQVHREQRWLPFLRSRLSLEVPEPLGLGRAGCGYPWSWSVYRWIAGDTAASRSPVDRRQFAIDLASFLNALHHIPAAGGPEPGEQNFFRGGTLTVYDDQFRRSVACLGRRVDIAAAAAVWDTALASSMSGSTVWVHGDIALGNLIVRQGRLAAVIDFGQLCVGDPACDLAIAWTFLRAEEREVFRAQLALEPGVWERGRAWALWKAAIVAAGFVPTNAVEGQLSLETIDEILRTVRA